MRGNFIIEEETLRRLFKHLTTAMADKSPHVNTNFKNGRIVQVHDIEELFADSLVGVEGVESVGIYVSNYTDDSQASVHLSSSVSYSVSGERGKAIDLEEAIVHELEAAKTWYSWRSHWVLLPLLLLASLIQLVFPLFKDVVKSDAIGIVMRIISIFGVFLSIAVVSHIIFPPVILNFGIGRRRYKQKIGFIYFIVVVLGLGVSIGVLGNYLSKLVGI